MIGGKALDNVGFPDYKWFWHENEIQASGREVSWKRTFVLRVIGVVRVLGRAYQELPYRIAKSL